MGLELSMPITIGIFACLASPTGLAIEHDGASGLRDEEEVRDLDSAAKDKLDPKL